MGIKDTLLYPALAGAQSTVDADAKPYMVMGGWIAGFVLLPLGLYFLIDGIRYQTMASTLAGGPSVPGRVEESGVAKRIDQDSEGTVTWYTPRIRYSYAVNGVAYRNEIVRIGLADYGYLVEKKAAEHAARYPAGAVVPVHYDPADPMVAALEAGQVGGGRKIFAGAIFVGLSLAAFVFAVWIGSLATS